MKKLLMINIIDEILLRKSALIEMVNDELNVTIQNWRID